MRSGRRWLPACLVLLSACTGGSVQAISPGPIRQGSEEAQLLEQAPAAAQAAGCGPVQTTGPYPGDLDGRHIGSDLVPVPPPLGSYPSIPPASGPHLPSPLPAGVYREPPDVYASIHSLEHAAVIIWYERDATTEPEQADELARVQTFFAGIDHQTKVIVAPYDYPDQGAAGSLPAGATIALVAWNRIQTCARVSLPVAYAFVARYRFPPEAGQDYLGEAPELEAPIG